MNVKNGWWEKYGTSLLLVMTGILHLGVNLYFLSRENIPPSYDCAHHLMIAHRMYEQIWADPGGSVVRGILDSSAYYPPLPYLATAVLYIFTGESVDAARLSLILWMWVLMGSVYASGQKLYNREAGLVAALIVSLYPITFGLTRSYYPDMAVLAMTSLAFTLFLKSEACRKPGWTVAFGVAAGLAQLTKWTAFVFWAGPAVAVGLAWWLLENQQDEEKKLKDHRFLNWMLWGYLAAFVLFALGLDFLLDATTGVKGYIRKLALSTLLFHLILVAGVLVSLLRKRFQSLWAGASSTDNRLKSRILYLVLAGVAAAVVCLPWYLHHLEYLVFSTTQVATDVAANRELPTIADTKSLLAYLFFFENHHVHLFFFLLFVAALVFSPRKYRPVQYGLLFGILIGYLAMTCVRLKDPRYSMPFLYLAALITAVGFQWIRRRKLRWTFEGGAIGLGALQFLVISFGLGLAPGDFVYPVKFGGQDYGFVTLFRSTGYGSYEKMGQDWRQEEIFQELKEALKNKESLLVYFLVNHPSIHYGAYQYYALKEDLPIKFEFPFDDAGYPLLEKNIFKDPDFLLWKRGGDQGPFFSVRGVGQVTSLLKQAGSGTVFGFQSVAEFDLPDGSRVELWEKQGKISGSEQPPFQFGRNSSLTAWSLEASEVKKGEKVDLRLWMNLSPEIAGDHHLFIHFYTPSGEFMGSFGGPFPEVAKRAEQEIVFELDTGRAEKTGLGQLAIGIWNPETGKRLLIRDQETKKRIGDIVFLNAFLEIHP